MRTKEQYMEALGKMKDNFYFDGEKISRLDERQMDTINTIGTTYDMVEELSDLMKVKSHLIDETINRFTHIHQSTGDLHKKQDMTRRLCQKVGGCIQRCMGCDGANAVYNVSYEADKMNKGETIEIITSDVVAKENIERFGREKHELLSIDQKGELFKLSIKK